MLISNGFHLTLIVFFFKKNKLNFILFVQAILWTGRMSILVNYKLFCLVSFLIDAIWTWLLSFVF